ncbi:hypothetical protein ACX8XN_18450 [Calditrichota bacterium GD2]
MNMRTAALIILTILLAFNMTLAQKPDSEFHVGIYIGPSLPQGEYAETNGDKSGYAQNGIGAMVELRKNIHKATWVSSLIFSSNSTDANAMQDQLFETGLVADDHFSVWAMTGLSLRKALSENVFIYGSGLFGLLFSNYPDIYTTDGFTKTTYTYSSTTTLGYGLGAGLSVFKMNLAIRYCMASPTYERSGDWLGLNGDKKLTIPADNLFILFGYEF